MEAIALAPKNRMFDGPWFPGRLHVPTHSSMAWSCLVRSGEVTWKAPGCTTRADDGGKGDTAQIDLHTIRVDARHAATVALRIHDPKRSADLAYSTFSWTFFTISRVSDDARGRWRGRRSILSHRDSGCRERGIRLVRQWGMRSGGGERRRARGTQPAGPVS